MAFITVQDWMVKNFNLKGNELLAYALIYGFSQDGESEFKGSISYISEWLNTSKSTTMRILKKLIEMGVIKKRTVTIKMPLHQYLALIITMPLNRKPMYVRYFMDAEIMSALVNVLPAERQDAAKFVTTISQDSAKNLLSLHMYVTVVQRKRTA